LDNRVIAVLPSISSATVEAGRQERQQHAEEGDRGETRVLVHLDVFTDVKYEMKIVTINKALAKKAMTKEGRLADGFFGSGKSNGE